jgi:hypothetical protein
MRRKFVALSAVPALCGLMGVAPAQVVGQDAVKEAVKPIETTIWTWFTPCRAIARSSP